MFNCLHDAFKSTEMTFRNPHLVIMNGWKGHGKVMKPYLNENSLISRLYLIPEMTEQSTFPGSACVIIQ